MDDEDGRYQEIRGVWATDVSANIENIMLKENHEHGSAGNNGKREESYVKRLKLESLGHIQRRKNMQSRTARKNYGMKTSQIAQSVKSVWYV